MALPIHRQKYDGTFDSICLTCFQTIANRQSKEALAEDEWVHTCAWEHFDRSKVAKIFQEI